MRSLVFFLAAVNPPYLLAALPLRQRTAAAAIGASVAFVVLVGIAAASGPMLEALDVSASTFRIAAGAIMLGGGAMRLLDPVPSAVPPGAGWRAGLVPLAFPLLLAPDVVALAISLGADQGVASTAGGAAAALVVFVALAAVVRRSDGWVVPGLARLLAAMLIVAGVALAVDGIQDL